MALKVRQVRPRARTPVKTRARLTPETFPESPRLGEETFRFGRVVAGLLVEFLEQLALAARQVYRRLDRHLDIHVAHLIGAQDGHTLALEAELLAGLRPFGN